MLRHNTSKAALAVAMIGIGLAGCDGGTGPGDASVRVLLTDAPLDYLASAWVDIGAVELLPANGGAPVLLTDDGTDGLVDLMTLQGDVTRNIAEADIEAGEYSQLRLIVEAARVKLAGGREFEGTGSDEKDLVIPSGAQTGIKLNLAAAGGDGPAGPITIASGETILVVDFDVSQSFVIQGNPETPAGVKGMSFKPTLRVTLWDMAASISGTVTGPEGVSVEGLTVTAEPDDDGSLEPYQSMTGTALTDADGNYTIYFLVPGNYTVTVAAPAGTTPNPESVAVELENAEDETGVDFALVANGS
jgi:hypothetical protein